MGNPMVNGIKSYFVFWIAAFALAGCQMTPPGEESGPKHTTAFFIQVETSFPGVTIETNNVTAGRTPLTLKVFGDSLGSFHNFGNPEFVVRAIPSRTNEFPQTKIFRTGVLSAPGDPIPGLLFFDMTKPQGALLIDSIPSK
jgi:hypothetical protein